MKGSPMRFAGYAALFDISDADHDTLRFGAFTRTLAERGASLPLLWQHRQDRPIGTVERATEDARGLRVIARIDKSECRAAALLARREVNGLSFGYRTRRARHSDEGRELIEVDLFEISLVRHPLQLGSRIHLIA